MLDIFNKNYLINGDNLEVLLNIKDTIHNKISTIYIDPPYNTGKKMGKYNDSWPSKSEYINFLKPRIELSKDLLKDGGMIFVSIGERMQARLKILLEDVFGEKNHVGTIIWKNKYSVSNDKKGITSQNEYIFVYTNNIKKIHINNDPLREEYVNKTYKNIDNDPNGPWRDGVQMWKAKNPDSSIYEVVSPSGVKWSKRWNFSPDSFKKLEEEGKVWWGVNNDKCPTKKVYLKDTKGTGITNIWDGKIYGYTSNGTNLLKNMLNIDTGFLYPKPVSLIKRIIQITHFDDNDIVLDFFAGSGTTGQAVLEFNHENDTDIKFILITNDENDICSNITLPRLMKVYNGYSLNKTNIPPIGNLENFNYINNLDFL